MASRMRKRSCFSVASFAETTELRYCTRPMAARIEISEITISSSTSVKPAFLPVFILRAIEGLAFRFRVDVVDVAAAPRGRVGLVAVGAQAPLGRLRNRIDR